LYIPNISLGEFRYIASLGHISSNEAVDVFNAALLPGMVGLTEEYRDFQKLAETTVAGKGDVRLPIY
jgi:hypothetical protein